MLQKLQGTFDVKPAEIMNGFLTGFNHATGSGPLCEEPMQGACFIVQQVETLIDEEVKEESEEQQQDTYGNFGGQIISVMKDLCKKAFLNAQPRIAEGMYLISMQANPENYGIVYALI
jgi:ribosome assembly protein 1